MKQTCRGFLLTLLFFSISIIPTFGNEISVTLDQVPLHLSSPAVIQNDRVLVPMRSVMEALGYEVVWFQEEAGIKATKGDTLLYLKLNNPIANVNGEPAKLDAPATLIGDTTMVPLRFVATHSGATVLWDEKTQVISISNPQPEVAIAQNPADSVVLIQTNKMQGSGIILSEDGLICTNYHVLDGASTMQLVFNDGSIYQGDTTVVGMNPNGDIALLRINKSGLTAALPQTTYSNGEEVLAIGSPLGVRNKQSNGVINSSNQDMISFSAPINQGSSGGALFNKNGQLLGMSAAFDPEQSLAIPLSLILQVPQDLQIPLKELKNHPYSVTPPKNLRFHTEDNYAYVSWSPQYSVDYFHVYLSHTEGGAFTKMTNSTTKNTQWFWGFPQSFGISVSDNHPVYIKVTAVRNGVETAPSEILKISFD